MSLDRNTRRRLGATLVASLAPLLVPIPSAAQSPAAPAAPPAAGAKPAAEAAPAVSDPKALAVADAVLEALGGRAAWEATRFLRFDFAVETGGEQRPPRRHWWDKHTGRHRVEGQTREGQPFVVLHNLQTREGQAYLNGQRLQGDEEKAQLERGYQAWVNDTYWLLMPYKMRDPGVVLGYEGQAEEGGESWDKLRLSFQNVGLTPGDRYWVYVNTKTRLVDRWEFILQNQDAAQPPTRFDWKSWTRHGGILLAPERVNAATKRRIFFPVLEVPGTIADATFSTPAPAAGE